MPVIEIPEFEKYKEQGYKGTFIGGCVVKGEGSRFRARAHAHCFHGYPHFGWICVLSSNLNKRVRDSKTGKLKNTMWHELSHILCPNHSHDDAWRKVAKSFGVRLGKKYKKKRRKSPQPQSVNDSILKILTSGERK